MQNMPFSGTGQIGFYPQIPFTVIPDGYNFKISVKAVSARHLKQLNMIHVRSSAERDNLCRRNA